VCSFYFALWLLISPRAVRATALPLSFLQLKYGVYILNPSRELVPEETFTGFGDFEALLDVATVQAGDVMLTCGNSAISKGIVLASGGPFSHAAVWIPFTSPELESDTLILAEADGFGVGATPIMPITLSSSSLREVRSVYLVKCLPGRGKLLRHPDIGTVPKERLLAASAVLQAVHFHKPYSDLSRLVDALDVPVQLRPAATNFKRFVALLTMSAESKGVFCSELVALFYAELGLPLFPDARAAITVSPNHLNEGSSLLKEVDAAFLNPADFIGWEYNRVDLGWDRGSFLPGRVKARLQVDKVTALVTGFADWTGSLIDKHVETMVNLDLALEEMLSKASVRYEEVGDVAAMARNDALRLRSNHLSLFLDAISRQHNHVRTSVSVTEEQREGWLVACSELLKQYGLIRGHLLHMHLRQNMLSNMRILRLAEKHESLIISKKKLRGGRRKLAKTWREYVEDRLVTSSQFEQLFKTPNLEGCALIYVEKTLEAAVAAILQEPN
jgi:hypothetical protein